MTYCSLWHIIECFIVRRDFLNYLLYCKRVQADLKKKSVLLLCGDLCLFTLCTPECILISQLLQTNNTLWHRVSFSITVYIVWNSQLLLKHAAVHLCRIHIQFIPTVECVFRLHNNIVYYPGFSMHSKLWTVMFNNDSYFGPMLLVSRRKKKKSRLTA